MIKIKKKLNLVQEIDFVVNQELTQDYFLIHEDFDNEQ